MYVQYIKWIGNIVTKLDFGYSFLWGQPVNDILLGRMGMTFFIAFLAFVVCWGLAIPVGIFVAVKQYSIADYFFTFFGFIGLATPGFPAGPGADVYLLCKAGDQGGWLVFTRDDAIADELGQAPRFV